MQYVQIKNGKIVAVADWKFPDSSLAKEKVVRNEEGQFVYESEINEEYEQSIRDKREAERLASEQAKKEEEARIPDLETAAIDLAEYIASLEDRIAELESQKST